MGRGGKAGRGEIFRREVESGVVGKQHGEEPAAAAAAFRGPLGKALLVLWGEGGPARPAEGLPVALLGKRSRGGRVPAAAAQTGILKAAVLVAAALGGQARLPSGSAILGITRNGWHSSASWERSKL